MFTSFSADEAVTRYSPGEHLLNAMVRDLCGRGVATIDLGIGEARYKDTWCPRRIPVFNQYIAITPAGQVLRAARLFQDRAKDFLKRHPALFAGGPPPAPQTRVNASGDAASRHRFGIRIRIKQQDQRLTLHQAGHFVEECGCLRIHLFAARE